MSTMRAAIGLRHGVALAAAAIAVTAWLGAIAPPASAISQQTHVQAELIAEKASILPARAFWVAVRLKMDRGWHTYWRNPGDAGLPTKIEWRLPDGFSSSSVQWPYPQRIEALRQVSYGYEDEVLLLTEITAAGALPASKPITIGAHVDWVECKDVCLKGATDLQLSLPVSPEPPRSNPQWQDSFERAMARVPLPSSPWKIRAVDHDRTIGLQMIRGGGAGGTLTGVMFFPEEPAVIDHTASQAAMPTAGGYLLELMRSSYSEQVPKSLRGVLVCREGWVGPGSARALRVDVPIEPRGSF